MTIRGKIGGKKRVRKAGLLGKGGKASVDESGNRFEPITKHVGWAWEMVR